MISFVKRDPLRFVQNLKDNIRAGIKPQWSEVAVKEQSPYAGPGLIPVVGEDGVASQD